MTQELIESLTAIHTSADEWVDGLDDEGYIDWSANDNGRRGFEVGRAGEAVQVWLSREQMRDLHRRLTVTLLAEQQ